MTKLLELDNKEGETLRMLYDEAESNVGIIFLHGFERTSVEYKFKNIVDALYGKVNLFRFDFSGCGMSDGEFGTITAEKYVGEIELAIQKVKQENPNITGIFLVAHSFAVVPALLFVSKNSGVVEKLVMFGPALNQKVLQRYWFAQKQNVGSKKKITVQNYAKHMTEKDLEKYVRIASRPSKAHVISKAYYMENKDKNYQELFSTCGISPKNMLILHGDKDEAVPIESNDMLPKGLKVVKVKGGDHDLQSIAMVKQYLKKAVTFLSV
jgi:pimeloyl-ACP methyl ester carboxylesterase